MITFLWDTPLISSINKQKHQWLMMNPQDTNEIESPSTLWDEFGHGDIK